MSPKKLKRFQTLLVELSERVRGEVNHVVASIHEDVDAKPHISAFPLHIADIAADAVDADLKVLHAERDMLDQIKFALQRIEDGTFGRCTSCDREITEQRLLALPYVAQCVHCARAESQAHA